MFRRIELIHHAALSPEDVESEGKLIDHYKHGLTGISPKEVSDAWIYKLRGPYGKRSKGIPRNALFYFTEKGWKEVGREVVKACIKTGQEYKVISIKETDAEVVWRDNFTGYEVAIQPKRKKNKS